jgi:hypothetical protein
MVEFYFHSFTHILAWCSVQCKKTLYFTVVHSIHCGVISSLFETHGVWNLTDVSVSTRKNPEIDMDVSALFISACLVRLTP